MRLRVAIVLVIILVSGALLPGCDQVMKDVEPKGFRLFELFPDEVYMYNGAGSVIRFDPLVNDSIRTSVRVSYSQPKNGQLKVEVDGTYYTPNPQFYGVEDVTYTVCSGDNCQSEKMTIYVEAPLDPSNCTTVLAADSLIATRNQPAEIRIFKNDVICPQPIPGISIFKPQKGTYKTVQYSGSLKNTVYIYYPPKDFVGEDTFKYRVHPDPANFDKVFLEVTVKVTVK